MRHQRPRTPAARSQRGFALIAILALAALIAAFLISSGLSRSSTDLSNEREQRSMDALRQAKAALIAYAAAADWHLQAPFGSQYLQPGALPCPDTNAPGAINSGKATCSGSNTSSQIGRLPWITMNIDDLRDASGEQIWYAVSHDFRKFQCQSAPDLPDSPNGCTRINSDTQGQLTVTGTESASNVVAVLIAPGGALSGQVRPNSTAANYVESFAAGDNIHYTFTTNATPSQANNDRIVIITQQELMAAVEPVVAARLERDIAPLVQNYYNRFGAYPYPAPFGDPSRSQTNYKGAQGATVNQGGLLPVTTDTTFLTWSSPITVTQISGGTGNGLNGPSSPGSCTVTGSGNVTGGTGCTLDSVDCSHSTSSNIVCEVKYFGGGNDRPAISLAAPLLHAAYSFPAAFTSSSPNMIGDDDNPLLIDNVHASTDPNFTDQWSWSAPPDVPTFFLPVTNYAFSVNDGSAVVTFTGRLQNAGSIASGGTNGRVVITIPRPTSYDTITNSDWNASPDTAWFIANQWFRQTYYAVSPGYLPTQGNTCTPQCLQVNNLRPAYTTSNNKRAILVLAGRSLTSVVVRPGATPSLNDYFENANLSAANGTTLYVYENRIGNPTSINDRVVVISPPPP